MAYAEIQQRMPAEYEARVADKLRYRYPRGESYLDVIARLEPVTIELERQRAPVLIIAHQARAPITQSAPLPSVEESLSSKALREPPRRRVPPTPAPGRRCCDASTPIS